MTRLLLVLPLLLVLAACDANDDVVTATSTVTVNYVGRLEDGSIFDQGQNATFNLQGVIPGFRSGMLGKIGRASCRERV